MNKRLILLNQFEIFEFIYVNVINIIILVCFSETFCYAPLSHTISVYEIFYDTRQM